MEYISFLFPLLAGFFYAAAALFLKAGSREGVGPVRTTILVLWAIAAAFLVFYPWGEFPAFPASWWPSLIVGITFVMGNFFLVLAYAKGDVSVATPVMGSKVLIVAIIVALISEEPVALSTWVAAVMTTAALVLLAIRPRQIGQERGRAGTGFIFALAAAGSFAVFDVLIQEFSPAIRFGLLAPFAMVFAALGSLYLLRFARERTFRFSARAWLFLAPGIGFLTLQAMLLIWTIGTYGNAPTANILYGSRGIWSVLLVLILGSLLGDAESLQNRRNLGLRLAGAVLMIVGISLVFY